MPALRHICQTASSEPGLCGPVTWAQQQQSVWTGKCDISTKTRTESEDLQLLEIRTGKYVLSGWKNFQTAE